MHRIDFDSNKELKLDSLLENIEGEIFTWEKVPGSAVMDIENGDSDEDVDSEEDVWRIYRNGKSTTPFVLVHFKAEGQYSLFMESLASYSDYRYFADFCDIIGRSLGINLTEDGVDLEALRSDEWIEESIGEEIAYLKAVLSAGYRYMFSYGNEVDYYVDNDALAQFATGVTSSTPRIYGYVQYALKNGMLLTCENRSDDYPDIEVEVPEHKPIGKVKSWQTDGSETWETYSREDIGMLLKIGRDFKAGRIFPEGVVLNDLGTIYQEGIGVTKDYSEAVFWYEKAIERGDTLYAPSNLGDVWRKGGNGIVRNLSKAMEAYSRSSDPYAHYRMGEAFEEGWAGKPDSLKAFQWYIKAAEAGHHLAVKRIRRNSGIFS